MEKHLLEFVQTLKTDSGIGHFDEPATKQTVVLRLLSLLGWNIFDLGLEVCPEYPISGEKVDYSLKIDNINRVFIEAKRIGQGLERGRKQVESFLIKLSKCAAKHGVKMAILTNGIIWHFYLPWQKNDEVDVFCTIDILQSEPQETAINFIKFLAKENISSGEAIQNAISAKTKTKKPVSLISSSGKSIIKDIQQFVSQHYGVEVPDLQSGKRSRSIAFARQVAMCLTRELTTLSLKEIGAGFGGKDHSTIIHAIHKVQQLERENSSVKNDLALLRSKLKS